jgi:hypothetical protein
MNWKLYSITILIAVAGGFLIGYLQNKEKVVVQLQEVEKIVQKEAETVVVTKWKDKVITIEKIVRPDGTIEERTIEAEREVAEEFRKKEKEITDLKEKLSKKESSPVLSKYSLGLQVPLKFQQETPIDYTDASLFLGTRVLGPVWLEGSFQPNTREITIGVRYEL